MVTAQYVQFTGEGRGGGRNDKWGFGEKKSVPEK